MTTTNLHNMVHIILEEMQYLTWGFIYVGSTPLDRKIKSLTQRWFTKCKVADNKEGSSDNKGTFFPLQDIPLLPLMVCMGLEK